MSEPQEPLETPQEWRARVLGRKRKDPATVSRPEGFKPLELAGERYSERYAALASRAHSQPRAAIKLKCLECCGWSYPEAKSCEIRTCALWAFNRRIFK